MHRNGKKGYCKWHWMLKLKFIVKVIFRNIDVLWNMIILLMLYNVLRNIDFRTYLKIFIYNTIRDFVLKYDCFINSNLTRKFAFEKEKCKNNNIKKIFVYTYTNICAHFSVSKMSLFFNFSDNVDLNNIKIRFYKYYFILL